MSPPALDSYTNPKSIHYNIFLEKLNPHLIDVCSFENGLQILEHLAKAIYTEIKLKKEWKKKNKHQMPEKTEWRRLNSKQMNYSHVFVCDFKYDLPPRERETNGCKINF